MTRGDYYELYDSNPSQNGRISFTCTYRLYRITHWCDQKRGHAIYFRFPFEDCVAGIDNFADLGKSDYLLYNGSRICHLSGTTSNVHRGCSVGGNYGFLVIPLIMTLFGDQGGNVYIPICSVIDTTLVWTLGFTLFTNGVGQKENPWKKIIMNPIFISIILGLCLTSFHIPVPDMIMNTIDSVGNTCYSWGLIYLGCSLGFMKLTNIFKYRSMLVLVFTKLLVIPLIVYFISHHFLTNVESMILMLISAAPSMTTSSMIAEQYHLDEEYASTAVVTTTLFCMLIIPLLFGLISL